MDETTLMILTHVAFPGGGSGKRASCPTVVLSAALHSSQWAIKRGKWFLVYFGAAVFPPESDFIMLFRRGKSKLSQN